MKVSIHDVPMAASLYTAVLATDGGVLIAGVDGSLFRWRDGAFQGILPAADPVVALAASGDLTVVGTPDSISLLEGSREHGHREFGATDWGATRAAVLRLREGGTVVAWGDERGGLQVASSGELDEVARYAIHAKAISRLFLVDDEECGILAVTCSDDRHVVVTAVATGERLHDFARCAGWVIDVLPLVVDLRLVGLAVADRVGVTIWEIPTGRPVLRVRGVVSGGFSGVGCTAAWSAAGRTWFIEDGRLASWPTLAPEPVGAPLVWRGSRVESGGRTIAAGDGAPDRENCEIFRLPAPLLAWLPDPARRRGVGLLATGSLVEVVT